MNRFFLTFIYSLLISCAVFAGSPAGTQKAGKSLFDAWEAQPTTEIEFHVNFDTLEARRKSLDKLPAKVIQNGKALDLDVTVRGKFRRRACVMPPMKLQFKKDGLRALGLNTHNDFKLVTHCMAGEAGQDALLREQLAYELYQTISPNANFRTQLLTINYVNTADGSTLTSYGILIEDLDELEDRMGMKSCKDCYNTPADQVNNAETFALFQYMIGNSDYCTQMVRNLKLLRADNGEMTAVPYDFDYSGLVNASYATGMPHFNETKVTDRTLIWKYDASPEFDEAIAYYLSLQETLLDQVDTYDNLSAGSKREITKYLKGFYKELKKADFDLAK